MNITDKILKEAQMTRVEALFDESMASRFAFIWRDVTHFQTVESKREMANRIERLIRNGGKGLPTADIDPKMLVATQREVDKEKITNMIGKDLPMPFVVKLNWVYYLMDGHHRVSASLLSNDKYLKVKLLDLDEKQ